jgi:hypothetical protein
LSDEDWEELTLYDAFISLGGSCQTAHQLEVNKLKGPTLPFDWVVSPFSSVHTLIANDFADLLEKENLTLVQDDEVGWYVHDEKYRIRFLHDFPLDLDFMRAYDAVRSKYERRSKRLLELLNTSRRVLLIRLDSTREEAQAFAEMLRKKFPQLRYDLLALGNTPEMQSDWALPRITNLFLPQPVPYFWAGLDKPWREILAMMLHAPVGETVVDADLHARLEPDHKEMALRRGETKPLGVRVVNESWTPLGFGSAEFGLSYHLLSDQGHLLRWDNERAPFERALQAGEARDMRVNIVAPKEPGSYYAELDLVWEGVLWLKEKGSATSMVRLCVV